MGAEFLPAQSGLLALMLGLLVNEGLECCFISKLAAIAVEVGPFPVRQRFGEAPATVDLPRFCSGQVLMLSGLSFKGHGAFPA